MLEEGGEVNDLQYCLSGEKYANVHKVRGKLIKFYVLHYYINLV